MAALLHEIKTLLNYSVWFRGGHIYSTDVWQGGGNSEPVAKLVRGDFELHPQRRRWILFVYMSQWPVWLNACHLQYSCSAGRLSRV
jgi:hypothetical protein